MGGGGREYPPCCSAKQCSPSSCFIYFTDDKPQTDGGAVIETRCKQRERRKEKKQRQGRGGKAESPGGNKQQITSRVTHFIFQMLSMVGGKGGREIEGTRRGSGGDGVK